MEALKECEDLQKAIAASMADQEVAFENDLINIDPKSNEEARKSSRRKRSKQRGVIDEDDDEGDIALDVNKVVNDNKANLFGSDEHI